MVKSNLRFVTNNAVRMFSKANQLTGLNMETSEELQVENFQRIRTQLFWCTDLVLLKTMYPSKMASNFHFMVKKHYKYAWFSYW